MEKIDPRVVRTRKLIMESFIELAMRKEFKDITIKDITSAATVNRATFYDHFLDKYDLLDKVLEENVMSSLLGEMSTHEALNKEMLQELFLAVIHFQKALSTRCQRSYEAFKPKIEEITKKKLQEVFFSLLQKEHPTLENASLNMRAIILSWGLYGTVVDYFSQSSMNPIDYFQQAIPLLLTQPLLAG
ncbi:TetR family transcriptional regulator [Lysinibacillus sp. NPDC097287]|uniref:TetR family transcriptional regulator n=1 Tax=Lysinibacillus sp. NPDC097287 TaxID=3364144 RepID=UPI00380D2A12